MPSTDTVSAHLPTSPGHAHRKTQWRTIAAGPAADVAPRLRSETAGAGGHELPHLLTGLLLNRLREDDELFAELRADVARARTDDSFTPAELQLLVDTARDDVHRREALGETLDSLVFEDSTSPGLRAQALRCWAPDPRTRVVRRLHTLVTHGNPEVVAAAGAVVAWWEHSGRQTPEDLVLALAERTGSSPMGAVRPEVLRALAHSSVRAARSAVQRALDTADEPSTRAAAVGATAPHLPVEDLAAALEQAAADGDEQTGEALRAALATRPERVQALRDAGHTGAWLSALELLPDLVGPDDAAALARYQADPDPALAGLARRLIHLAPDDPTLREVQRPRLPVQPQALRATATTTGVGYLLGYHKADALYQDLVGPAGLIGNHFHVGLFCGFSLNGPRTIGALRLVQATGALFDTVQVVRAERVFQEPDLDIAAEMAALHRSFLLLVEGSGTTRNPVRTVRRTPGLTPAQAESIVGTALSLSGRGIGYTAAGMVGMRLFADLDDWDGAVPSIAAVRCDGVVEYAYEANSARVCSGKDADHWNIAAPGAASLENHGGLHTLSYELGELCPRIQAGDHGDADHRGADDTRMTSSGRPTVPRVVELVVTPGEGSQPTSVRVRVDAARYDHVFVRLTVRHLPRAGQPGQWRFLCTVDPGVPPEPWRFVRCRTGRARVTAWQGDTLPPSPPPVDGRHEFRAVAVDLAGNVSAERRTTVDLTRS